MPKTKEELARIGAQTRFKSGKKAAELGSAGGIASGIAKRERKTIREELEYLLAKQLKNKNGEDISTREAISTAMIGQAIKGNVKAFIAIRDTIGENPTEKHAIAGADGELITPVNITITPISADIDENKNKEKTDT